MEEEIRHSPLDLLCIVGTVVTLHRRIRIILSVSSEAVRASRKRPRAVAGGSLACSGGVAPAFDSICFWQVRAFLEATPINDQI